MEIYMEENNLNFFEALASSTRLKIISLLSKKEMSIKDIATALNLSSAVIVKHIQKLEKADIISTKNISKNGNNYKICVLLNTTYEISSNWKEDYNNAMAEKKSYLTEIPVGQFTDIKVTPPCGMASEKEVLGDLDRAEQMMLPARVDANLIWLANGHIEYKLPNYVAEDRMLTDIKISGEFGAEAPGYCDEWPTTISVYLNDIKICKFTTPGDFGSKRGLLTPMWWDNNQYGILVEILINKDGVHVNGERVSSKINITSFENKTSIWKLRFETFRENERGGGLTIFGDKFGNYRQNIIFNQLVAKK